MTPMDEPLPPPRDDDAPRRARLEALGRAAEALLDDLQAELEALGSRARLAVGEARAGRPALPELERVAEGAEELERMLRDAVGAVRGETVSPEAAADVQAEVERTVRRLLPALRPVEVRLDARLPAGTAVRGRASLLGRAVAGLVREAATRAQAQVRVLLAPEPVPGRPGETRVAVVVEGDGPATMHGLAAEGRLDTVAWLAEQLGGSLRLAPGELPGTTRVELRLPAAPPLAATPLSLLGRRLVVLEPEDPAPLAERLRAAGAAVVSLPADAHEARLVRLVVDARPEALLLDAGLGEGRALRLWEALSLLAPPLAARVAFLRSPGDSGAGAGSLGRTGRPVLEWPVALPEVRRFLASLG